MVMHLHISMTTFQQCNSRVVVTETISPAKSKIFTMSGLAPG